MDKLDHARARYVELLLRHSPTLDDQIKDLAKVFALLVEAEQRRRQELEAERARDGKNSVLRTANRSR